MMMTNLDESYTDKRQDHIACSYGYQLVCVDGRFSTSGQICRSQNAIYKLINNMLGEVKCCKEGMKNNFKKECIMTKAYDKNFQMTNKCHICNKLYIENYIRVSDHCHKIGKYRSSAHQSCSTYHIN